MHRTIGFLLAVLLSYSLVEAVHEYKIDDEITVQYLDAEETVEKVKVIQVLKNAVEKVLETVVADEGAEKVEPKEIEHVNEAAVLRVELISRSGKGGSSAIPEPKPKYILKIASTSDKEFLAVNEKNNMLALKANVAEDAPRALQGRLTRMYGSGNVTLPVAAAGRLVLKLEELYQDFFEFLNNMKRDTEENKAVFAEKCTLCLQEMVYTMQLYHDQGFVHGDIKAENFMRASPQTIDGIVIDLASSAHETTDPDLAKLLQACLTPQYAPYAWHLDHHNYVGTKERDIESLAYSMLYIVSDRFSVELDKIRRNPNEGERPAQYKALKLWLLKYLLTDEALKEMSEGLTTIFYKMIRIGLNGLDLKGVEPKDLNYIELRELIDAEVDTFRRLF